MLYTAAVTKSKTGKVVKIFKLFEAQDAQSARDIVVAKMGKGGCDITKVNITISPFDDQTSFDGLHLTWSTKPVNYDVTIGLGTITESNLNALNSAVVKGTAQKFKLHDRVKHRGSNSVGTVLQSGQKTYPKIGPFEYRVKWDGMSTSDGPYYNSDLEPVAGKPETYMLTVRYEGVGSTDFQVTNKTTLLDVWRNISTSWPELSNADFPRFVAHKHGEGTTWASAWWQGMTVDKALESADSNSLEIRVGVAKLTAPQTDKIIVRYGCYSKKIQIHPDVTFRTLWSCIPRTEWGVKKSPGNYKFYFGFTAEGTACFTQKHWGTTKVLEELAKYTVRENASQITIELCDI